jgi:hypothetical protein
MNIANANFIMLGVSEASSSWGEAGLMRGKPGIH